MALALLLVAGGATLIAVVLRGRRRKLIAALLVFPAALAIAVPAGAAVLASHQTAATKTVAPDQHTNQRTHQLAAWATSTVPTWTQLIAIENALSQQHDAIVANETEIANLTVAWQTEYLHITPHTLHPMVFTVLGGQLKQLVLEHAALATAYETSLQNEYQFFLDAAKNPVQLTALQTAATRTPADVQQAVTYDISVVETQLQQEAAINNAQQIASTQPLPVAGPFTFSAPVSGVVTQAFGPTSFTLEPPLTYNGVFYPHFHTGLDIAAPLNSLVGAAGPGQVILAGASRDSHGNLVGYGNYVVIRHPNGALTLYGHLNRILVAAGQIVSQGQVIGLLGSTGWSTGPHVHFEIRINGIFVDPAPYLAQAIR
ncbi:MAG: M23 family metallopeptidase [Candidatus Dormibacteraeota bacterium]|nr:M23 family metallopeptidase [Candidatus Dormibacteraeota bacterium]MBV9526041.1 M23 family metallopeptidase [Candidatus Dormibacteraeota bacterium]